MNSRKLFWPLLLLLLGGLGFFLYNKYRVAPDMAFNELPLQTETGTEFRIESLKGKKVLVCFYASWCGDCLQEMKNLNAVAPQSLQDVQILAITDEPLEKLIDFKNRKQYPFTFLKLKKSFNDLGIHAIPTSYVVNTHGEIVMKKVGYIDWKDASTLHYIQGLIQ